MGFQEFAATYQNKRAPGASRVRLPICSSVGAVPLLVIARDGLRWLTNATTAHIVLSGTLHSSVRCLLIIDWSPVVFGSQIQLKSMRAEAYATKESNVDRGQRTTHATLDVCVLVSFLHRGSDRNGVWSQVSLLAKAGDGELTRVSVRDFFCLLENCENIAKQRQFRQDFD